MLIHSTAPLNKSSIALETLLSTCCKQKICFKTYFEEDVGQTLGLLSNVNKAFDDHKLKPKIRRSTSRYIKMSVAKIKNY